ncbi:coiled-coil domain-containing protein 93 [Hyalella azteca]|uniref:Coiled-coil domain-containing protein 93 n=1 Tax=Hyalella azteca TaxID=294128 RepID=A0A8B7PHU8_HYAAZ|nr:coiled-coil domain-containing protein 93 [Hyalella azteca]
MKPSYTDIKDEEQHQMIEQCLKLLVSAGYFRAGVAGLPPFDKIVGGMTWCVENCCIDLDLDLMYNDSLTIGQKIGLTEHLVSVLLVLQCPHLLQPHQIQGLDAAHLLPVIQWLVRAALANRAQHSSLAQKVAAIHAPSRLSPPPAAAAAAYTEPSPQLIRLMSEVHCAHSCVRRWRLSTDPSSGATPEQQQEEAAYNTMLEYSPQPPAHHTNTNQPILVVAASAPLLAAAAHGAPLLSSAILRDKGGLERRVVALEARLGALELQAQEVQERRSQLSGHIKEASDALDAARAHLNNIESSHQKESVQELKRLVEEAEALKKSRHKLKKQQQQQAAALEQELASLQEAASTATPSEKLMAARQRVEQERLRHGRARAAAAAARQRLFRLQYAWDDVPGRAELAQYRHRLAELTHLMAASEGETRKFGSLLDTLQRSSRVLLRHLQLLNGVADSLHQTQGSAELRSTVVQRADQDLQRLLETKAEVMHERAVVESDQQKEKTLLHGLQETARLYTRTAQSLLHHLAKNQQLLQLCPPAAAAETR